MVGRGRGKKRKSEDFICDINDEDLSTDEDAPGHSCKMSKIDGKVKETSETEENPTDNENKSCNESVISLTDESNEMNQAQSGDQEVSGSSKEETSDDKNSGTDVVVERSDSTVFIEIDSKNSDPSSIIIVDEDPKADPNSSVIIIEDAVPVMVVSDDDDEEEGEIVDNLVVVDEVIDTPQPISRVTKTPEKDDVENSMVEDDTEFQVVEEIGPSPMPKQREDLINISFRCEKTMGQYGHLLVKFLKSFPELGVQTDKLSIKVNEIEAFEDVRTPKRKNKKKKAKKDLFVVDTNPSSNDDNSQFLQFRYTSKFEISEQAEPVHTATAASQKNCFNCGGSHALRECEIPKDNRRIQQARQQFIDRFKPVRYHVEQHQKLADFKPGVISENLRAALGLHENELPNYIYRMRNLGYPPGWLEEAKVTPSDLSLFNIDGKKVVNRKMATRSIDTSKIIEYPGFNMPLKKGFHDDFRRYKVKPYSKNMHMSHMIKKFQDEFRNEDTAESSSDMDMSEQTLDRSPAKTIEKLVKDRATLPVNSPSLVDLEEKKKELIDELNINQNQDDKSISNESEADVSQDNVEDKSEKMEPSLAVKSTLLGTPILESSSPYSRLPNPDNFSVGVSPVIDFENLPNSTGKYEELSKVLSKVRMTMKNIL